MGWYILANIFKVFLTLFRLGFRSDQEKDLESRRVQKPHPKHCRYEFWDRGFVKNCPIMKTAERNFISPLFSR